LPLDEIEKHFRDFLVFAREHPKMSFALTPIGCGLAGYIPRDIAPMFADAPPNVLLPEEFRGLL
jgi:hypothetical protein